MQCGGKAEWAGHRHGGQANKPPPLEMMLGYSGNDKNTVGEKERRVAGCSRRVTRSRRGAMTYSHRTTVETVLMRGWC